VALRRLEIAAAEADRAVGEAARTARALAKAERAAKVR
jgi:hypothetical protein